jgi:hypothetical protein
MTVAALALWGCGGGGTSPVDSGGDTKIDGGGGSGNAGRGGSGGATGTAGRGGSGGSTAGTGGGTAGTGGGTAGRGGTGGGTAGTGGSSTAGTGGSSTAGTGGSSTAGTGGSSTAGTGGSSTAGTGGSSTAGTGGGTAGTGGTTPACTNGASCALPGTGGAAGSAALNGVCANGVCTNCGADSTCQTAYGADHICLGTGVAANCVAGDCQQNSTCNGKICNPTTHFCTACTGDMSCTDAFGANHLCQGGTCVTGNCRNNGDCATGQICNASSQCVSCGGVDAACASYGAGYICVSNSCVMGTCHDNTECSGGQICNASHVCAGCGTDDAICGSGRICASGLCVAGNCHANPNTCSNGQVCLNNTCAACTVDTQCTSGQLCLSGGCVTGNCRIANNCSGGQVCASNNCAPCATDGACVAGYGPDHLCNSGSCVSGNCRAAGDCSASGTICNTGTLFCGACSAGAAGDTQCATEYAGAFICNGGVCVPGTCHSTANCSNGQICNLGNHTCEGCGTSDATCADAANYGPNHVCQSNACISGNCHVSADCSNLGQVCNGNTCGQCSSTAQCLTERGANHVCVGGACLAGNCNTSADCASSNQLCNTVTHSCEACTSDTQCSGDTQYGAMHICLGTGTSAQCVAGNCHDTSSDCSGGQICGIGTAHVCGSCGGSDTACKNDAFYTNGSICLANGGCALGDCHDTSTECTNGKLCGVSTAHTCGNCSAGATGDMQCTNDSRYGSGNICFQGLCGLGNCHASSADCTGPNAGLICGAGSTNTCGTCTADSACTSDAFYGANTICNTTSGKCVTRVCATNNTACGANTGDFCCGGLCTPGNCCVDGDCGAIGTACVNHTCSACNPVSGNKFYVDPVNGNDSTGTGSNTSGAMTAPGCAFKTITRAIAIIGASPPVGTQIIIVGAGSTPRGLAAGDTLPITVPTNTTITTTGGPITITLLTATAGNPSGFRLLNNNSAVSGDPAAPLILDGNSRAAGLGIQAATGVSANTFSISNVTIINTNGHGIRVNGGTLNIGAGVVVSGTNGDGLFVNGGVANVNNPSGSQTLFTANTQHGIEVAATGSVNITGTPASPVPSNGGTVVVSFNTTAGLRILQTPGAAGLLTSNINGVVSWGNSNRDLITFGGTKLKVRNSVFGGAPVAIYIGNNGNTAAGNDLTGMDFGTPAAFGKNYIQMPNGSLGFHSAAGVCVVMAANQGTLNVNAAGNFMTTAGNPGTQLNCSTAGGTVSTGTCANRNAFGVTAAAGTTITRDLSMCN